jgi:predicted transcriptional regulator
MASYGWVKEFPSIVDEHGAILVGNRRTEIAKELGIEPVVMTVTLGTGAAADAERLKLAIVSNIGAAPMTRRDRKRIAEHLYGRREWTMGRIAEALGVSQATITKDLKGLLPSNKPHRPNGGRPKGGRSSPKLDKAIEVAIESGGSLSREELSDKHGFSDKVAQIAVNVIKDRLKREPEVDSIDVSTFSETQKQKLERALRTSRAFFEKENIKWRNEQLAQINARVAEQVQQIRERSFPGWKKASQEAFEKMQSAQRLINNYKPPLTVEQFRLLLIVLHPDNSASSEARAAALQLFNDKKLWLTGKK